MNIFTALFRRTAVPAHVRENAVRSHIQQRIRNIECSKSLAYLIETMRDYDGFCRQAAIGRSVTLADPALLQAIAARLNDWVPQVRDAARSAVITLLPLMPAKNIIGILPSISTLRVARRTDHGEWLALFERDLLQWLSVDDLVAGLSDNNVATARACFDIVQRHALIDTASWISLGIGSRRDIVIARRAATKIGTLPADQQEALYYAALQSHFGAVRTIAVSGLLGMPRCLALHELATSLLLNPQSSVRLAAIGYLRSEAFNVEAYYRGQLVTPSTAQNVIRISLGALATLLSHADLPLIKSFLTSPRISVRASAYSAWRKLAEVDKDVIAAQALADDAPSIRKTALEMIRRQGAFIPFHVVCAVLTQYQEWSLLLQIAQLEKWNALEGIARVGMATGAKHPIRPALEQALSEWISTAGSYTRPTSEQSHFLLADETVDSLRAIAGEKADILESLKRELSIAFGK